MGILLVGTTAAVVEFVTTPLFWDVLVIAAIGQSMRHNCFVEMGVEDALFVTWFW